VLCIFRKIQESKVEITKIVGHTGDIATSPITTKHSIFYAHLSYKGEQWYNWAMVHFEETNNLGDEVEKYYPSRLLGYITTSGTRKAVIQCSINQIDCNDIQQNFIVESHLGTNFHVSL
jgi:hypothetical protein